MSELKKSAAGFVGCEYLEVAAGGEASRYLDCYRSFGWVPDENRSSAEVRQGKLHLKRDRKIANKAELTRLQRHFEACAGEIRALERAKTASASAWALGVGLAGTAFMAGSTFAVTHEPPVVWLCVLLAVPGLLGWILPYFLHRRLVARETARITPLIEVKYDEIYEICETGVKLL